MTSTYGGLALWLLWSLNLRTAAWTVGQAVREHTPTELPTSSWPGPDVASSLSAWPSGRQPDRFDAWPQTSYGTPENKLKGCWLTSVLRDFRLGWPSLCLGLTYQYETLSESDCERNCIKDPTCSVWAWHREPQGSSSYRCYSGSDAHDCGLANWETINFDVISAQRIMHGDVRVIKDLPGLRAEGLSNIGWFNAGDQTPLAQAVRCKRMCYSMVNCTYWSFSNSSDVNLGGCLVELPVEDPENNLKPPKQVPYPLTSASLTIDPSIVAGEYIQHFCPEKPSSFVEEGVGSDAPTDGAFTAQLICVLIAVAIVAALVAAMLIHLWQLKKKQDLLESLEEEETTLDRESNLRKEHSELRLLLREGTVPTSQSLKLPVLPAVVAVLPPSPIAASRQIGTVQVVAGGVYSTLPQRQASVSSRRGQP